MLPPLFQFDPSLALDAFVRVTSVLVLRSFLPPPFHSCKELLTNASSCIQLIDKGVIAVLSECLASEDEVVQERAAHDINIIITIVGSKGCENLLRTGAVENLILLLSSSSEKPSATYDVLTNACKRSSEIQDLLCDMKGLLESLLLQVERMGLVDSRKALGLIRTCLAGRRRPGDDVGEFVFMTLSAKSRSRSNSNLLYPP